RVQEIVGEMRGVAGAAPIAAQKQLAVRLPAVAQIFRKADDGRPVEARECGREAPGIGLEVLGRRHESGSRERVLRHRSSLAFAGRKLAWHASWPVQRLGSCRQY